MRMRLLSAQAQLNLAQQFERILSHELYDPMWHPLCEVPVDFDRQFQPEIHSVVSLRRWLKVPQLHPDYLQKFLDQSLLVDLTKNPRECD